MSIVVNTSDKASKVSSSRVTSETLSHTPTVGASMVVCFVDHPLIDGTLSATYNGSAMTAAVSRLTNGNKVYIFYLLAPPTGSSYNCVVTTSGSALKFLMTVVSLTGTKTSSPIGATSQGDFGSGTAMSLSTTTTVANSVLVDCFGTQNVCFYTGDGSQVTLASQEETVTDGTSQGSSYLTTTTVGSYTTSWTKGSGIDSNKTYVVAEILPPASGYTLTAAQGSQTLTGQTVALKVTRVITAIQGSYVLTGQPTSFSNTIVTWHFEGKNTTSYVDGTKHTTSYGDTAKSTTIWVEQNKS